MINNNDSYIYVEISLDKRISDFDCNGTPFCFKEILDTVSITDRIIYEVIRDYGLTLSDEGIKTSEFFDNDKANVKIEFGISLDDDADTIGSCIEKIREELKLALVIFNRNYNPKSALIDDIIDYDNDIQNVKDELFQVAKDNIAVVKSINRNLRKKKNNPED